MFAHRVNSFDTELSFLMPGSFSAGYFPAYRSFRPYVIQVYCLNNSIVKSDSTVIPFTPSQLTMWFDEEIPTQRNFSYRGFLPVYRSSAARQILNFLQPDGLGFVHLKINNLLIFISGIALIFPEESVSHAKVRGRTNTAK